MKLLKQILGFIKSYWIIISVVTVIAGSVAGLRANAIKKYIVNQQVSQDRTDLHFVKDSTIIYLKRFETNQNKFEIDLNLRIDKIERNQVSMVGAVKATQDAVISLESNNKAATKDDIIQLMKSFEFSVEKKNEYPNR